MRRWTLFASLSPFAFAGLAGLVVFAFGPEMTARLAVQLGQSAFDTGQGVVSYLDRTASLPTTLFVVLAWVVVGDLHASVTHRGSSDTRTTAEHTFALVAPATVPFVAIFARDRLVVVVSVGVILLAGAGAVFAGCSNARGVVIGLLYAVAPIVGGDVVASLVAGPTVARIATLAFPLAVDYAFGVASVRGRLRLGVAVSVLTFTVPARTYFPPATEATGFDPETAGLALGFAIAAAFLLLSFAAIGYATTRTADAG